ARRLNNEMAREIILQPEEDEKPCKEDQCAETPLQVIVGIFSLLLSKALKIQQDDKDRKNEVIDLLPDLGKGYIKNIFAFETLEASAIITTKMQDLNLVEEKNIYNNKIKMIV
ncbi:hypothetical protein ACJX0J_022191, partial [Zea mays]